MAAVRTSAGTPLEVATEIGRTVYRVGFGPDPWLWTPWMHAVGGRFDGRWDDPAGTWRTLYVADSAVGCYLEVLAHFRPDLTVMSALAAIDDDDDDSFPTISTGVVPHDWRAPRRVGTARMRGVFVMPSASTSLGTLRRQFGSLAATMGLDDLDAAAVRMTLPRQLTQRISAWLYALTTVPNGDSFAGVAFASRHGDDHRMWAVYEHAGDGPTSPALTDQQDAPIAADAADVVAAMRIHGLVWG